MRARARRGASVPRLRRSTAQAGRGAERVGATAQAGARPGAAVPRLRRSVGATAQAERPVKLAIVRSEGAGRRLIRAVTEGCSRRGLARRQLLASRQPKTPAAPAHPNLGWPDDNYWRPASPRPPRPAHTPTWAGQTTTIGVPPAQDAPRPAHTPTWAGQTTTIGVPQPKAPRGPRTPRRRPKPPTPLRPRANRARTRTPAEPGPRHHPRPPASRQASQTAPRQIV